MQLAKFVFDVGYFVRAVQVQLRFGELSRGPLRLLKLGLEDETAQVSWVARPPDAWDRDTAPSVREKNESKQALLDAIALRELLFYSLPGIHRATLRVFREKKQGDLELVITGIVAREQDAPKKVASLAMRAKLLGLQFWLEDGILEALRSEECAMSF